MEWVDSSRCDLDQCESSRNLCDSKLQIFAPKFSTLKLFSCSEFSKLFCLQGFQFNLLRHHATAITCRRYTTSFWRSRICRSSLTGPGNLGAWDYDGSRWVYSNFFIHVLPEVNTHFVTTFTTTEGEILITMYHSINGSTGLVIINDDIFAQPRTSYLDIFWSYSYHQQRYMLHPSAVYVFRFIRHRGGYLLSRISPKRSGQWWRW